MKSIQYRNQNAWLLIGSECVCIHKTEVIEGNVAIPGQVLAQVSRKPNERVKAFHTRALQELEIVL
jgi:hypothetical protein